MCTLCTVSGVQKNKFRGPMVWFFENWYFPCMSWKTIFFEGTEKLLSTTGTDM